MNICEWLCVCNEINECFFANKKNQYDRIFESKAGNGKGLREW